MKKTAGLLMTALVLLAAAAGWLLLHEEARRRTCEELLARADALETEGYHQDAILLYEEALNRGADEAACRRKKALASFQLQNKNAAVREAEEYLSRFGPDAALYAEMICCSRERQDWYTAYENLNRALKTFPEDETLARLDEEMRGAYEKLYVEVKKADPAWNGYRRVTLPDGRETVLGQEGEDLLRDASYDSLADFTLVEDAGGQKLFFSLKKKGECFYLDEEGNRRICPTGEYDAMGCTRNGRILIRQEGSFYYLDESGTVLSPGYREATPFSHGLAAIRLSEGWRIVDTDLSSIDSRYYADVKKDACGQIASAGRIAVNTDGSGFIFLDLEGRAVSKKYEDVKMFAENGQYAPVKKGGKWGVIDRNGQQVLPCMYEDLLCGDGDLISFRENGLWGIMDTDGTVYVSPCFPDMKEVNTDGRVFVMQGECYSEIQLMRSYLADEFSF